jgi:hypothetical protein
MNMSSCQSFELAPAPTSIATANVSGWLMKRKKHDIPAEAPWQKQAWQKACTALLGSFNRRFFWMDFNIHLVYYAESPQAKRVAFIPFSRLRAVTPITSPVKINAAKEGWVWGISLRTVNRSLDLWAQSEAEQLMWLDALNKAIGQDMPMHSFSALNSSAALTQSAVLGMASSRQQIPAFPTPSTPQLATSQLATPQMGTVDNVENRWAENSIGKSGSLGGLPPIKERATWETISDDEKMQGNQPAISASRKWDDWDN